MASLCYMKWFYNEVPHFNKNDRNQGTSMKGKSGNLNIALKYQEILGNILTISDNVNILWNVIKSSACNSGKWSLHVVNEHYTYICHIVCAKTIREFDDISGKYQGHIREFHNQFSPRY